MPVMDAYLELPVIAQQTGVCLGYNCYNAADFAAITAAQPEVPTTFAALSSYIDRLEIEGAETLETGTVDVLLLGFGNPDLTPAEKAAAQVKINGLVSKLVAPLQDKTQPNRIYFYSTTGVSRITAANLASVKTLLNTVETQYLGDFGKGFWLLQLAGPPISTTLSITFLEPGVQNGLAFPGGMMLQSSKVTAAIFPGVIWHECFHLLQYSFGYRTDHRPTGDWKWLFEGSARWAEVQYQKNIKSSQTNNLTEMFSSPNLGVYHAGYSCLPFWMTYAALTGSPAGMVALLTSFNAVGTPNGALKQALENFYTNSGTNLHGRDAVSWFFNYFSERRALGFWRFDGSGVQVYPEVVDETGAKVAVPPVKSTAIGLTTALNARNFNLHCVPLGADYTRITIDAALDGKHFKFQVVPVAPATVVSYSIVRKIVGVGKDDIASVSSKIIDGTLTFEEKIDVKTVNTYLIGLNGLNQAAGVGYAVSVSAADAGVVPVQSPIYIRKLMVYVTTGTQATGQWVYLLINRKERFLLDNDNYIEFKSNTTDTFQLPPQGLTRSDFASGVSLTLFKTNISDEFGPITDVFLNKEWDLKGLRVEINEGELVYDNQAINHHFGAGDESYEIILP